MRGEIFYLPFLFILLRNEDAFWVKTFIFAEET